MQIPLATELSKNQQLKQRIQAGYSNLDDVTIADTL
jgi:hypothetical protein